MWLLSSLLACAMLAAPASAPATRNVAELSSKIRLDMDQTDVLVVMRSQPDEKETDGGHPVYMLWRGVDDEGHRAELRVMFAGGRVNHVYVRSVRE